MISNCVERAAKAGLRRRPRSGANLGWSTDQAVAFPQSRSGRRAARVRFDPLGELGPRVGPDTATGSGITSRTRCLESPQPASPRVDPPSAGREPVAWPGLPVQMAPSELTKSSYGSASTTGLAPISARLYCDADPGSPRSFLARLPVCRDARRRHSGLRGGGRNKIVKISSWLFLPEYEISGFCGCGSDAGGVWATFDVTGFTLRRTRSRDNSTKTVE